MAGRKWKDYGVSILVLALAILAGAAFLYGRSWLFAMLSDSSGDGRGGWKPPQVERIAYDWEHPLLPAGSSVAHKTLRGRNDNRRLQVLASCLLPPKQVLEFYESKLVADGWKKYNPDSVATGAYPPGGLLFRKGDISFAVTAYTMANGRGSRFRLGVIRMPVNNPARRPKVKVEVAPGVIEKE